MASKLYLDLQQQGFLRIGQRRGKQAPAPPKPSAACELCLDWHAPGKHRYYVWTVAPDNQPINRQVATDLKTAQEIAENRARFQRADTAISRGAEPDIKGFKIVAAYEAITGRKVA